MSTSRAKRFEYAVDVREGRGLAEGLAPLDVPEGWSPEHLVLAALVRCSLTSLTYHARQRGATVTGGGSARGSVTKREDDGRYAFVEVECTLDVRIDPAQEGEALRELVALGERDCFIGASLTAKPVYHWRVDGRDV